MAWVIYTTYYQILEVLIKMSFMDETLRQSITDLVTTFSEDVGNDAAIAMGQKEQNSLNVGNSEYVEEF